MLVWVTARRYEPGGVTGIVATMFVCEKLFTVSEVVLSLTVGVVVPKFAPVIVILLVTRLTVALLMTALDAACTRGGTLANVKAKAAMMSAVFGADL